MVEPGAIVFIVFGSVGFAFVCYILVDKLIKNQMNRRFNTVAVEPETKEPETKEPDTRTEDDEKEPETKEPETKEPETKEEYEEIRGSNFV